MNQHEYWSPRLSELVDGTLEPEERTRADRHLAECQACREVVADLRRIVERATDLGDVQPSRDLWPEIEARIDPDGGVITLPTRELGPPGPRRRGVFLSLPLGLAAAAVLVLASSLVTWWVRPAAPSLEIAGGETPASVRSVAASEPGAPPEMAGELETLTEALAAGRDRLDPNTVRIIEKNLRVIERAIEESRQALVVDPSNAYLREHLNRAYQRKLSYLREATGIVEWSSS